MGIFSALVKTTIEVVKLPIDLVKDAATLGGTMTDEEKPYTAQRLDEIKKAAEDRPVE